MSGGRPLKFKSPEELQEKIDGYFKDFEKDGKKESKPYTISGLAFHLDICTQTLLNYSDQTEFFATIKRAKQRVEIGYEENLHGANASGSMFALGNFDWKNRQHLNIGGQPDNQLPQNDAQCNERLIELLNKVGASGASGTIGEEE